MKLAGEEPDPKEAFVIFKIVYDKYPNTLFSNIGMASGYSAFGALFTKLFLLHKRFRKQTVFPDFRF
jgi:hypothetical protein